MRKLLLVLIVATAACVFVVPRFFSSSPPFALTNGTLIVGDVSQGDEVKFARVRNTLVEGTVYDSLPVDGLIKKAGAQRLLWLLKDADYETYKQTYKNHAACPDSFLKPRLISVTVVTNDAKFTRWLHALHEGDVVRMRGTVLKLLSLKDRGAEAVNPAEIRPDDFNSRWFLLEEQL